MNRNYFAPVGGGAGQRETGRSIVFGTSSRPGQRRTGALWTMRNGYALCTEVGLDEIEQRLRALDLVEIDKLRGLLRVGLHWNVEVTASGTTGVHVSQALCSALPVSYTTIPPERWRSFATLILEGAYEATLWAAVLNTQRTPSNASISP